MLSNAIVLNLAYLALPKFAYIDELRVLVSERIGKLDRKVVDSVRETAWFCQAKALTEVRTFERMDFAKQPWMIDLPGLWGKLYNFFFYWRVGRIGAIALTAMSLALVLIAVGDASGATHIGECGFPQKTLGLDFAITLIAFLWPIVVVTAGQLVKSGAAKFITYQTKNLRDTFSGEATDVVDKFEHWYDTLPRQQ